MDWNRRQQIALAIVPKISSTLSIFGSSWIVLEVLTDKFNDGRGPKRNHPYHRLLLAMSVYDILESVGNFFSTWPIPQDTDNVIWASGTTATCSAQGFFLMFGVAIPIYNAMLSIYYVLIINYNISDESLRRRVEPTMHIVAFLWASVTSIVATSMGLMNHAVLWCWIAPYPLDCKDSLRYKEEGNCIRGDNAWIYRWSFYFIPLWICIFIASACIVMVYRFVKRIDKKSMRFRNPQRLSFFNSVVVDGNKNNSNSGINNNTDNNNNKALLSIHDYDDDDDDDDDNDDDVDHHHDIDETIDNQNDDKDKNNNNNHRNGDDVISEEKRLQEQKVSGSIDDDEDPDDDDEDEIDDNLLQNDKDRSLSSPTTTTTIPNKRVSFSFPSTSTTTPTGGGRKQKSFFIGNRRNSSLSSNNQRNSVIIPSTPASTTSIIRTPIQENKSIVMMNDNEGQQTGQTNQQIMDNEMDEKNPTTYTNDDENDYHNINNDVHNHDEENHDDENDDGVSTPRNSIIEIDDSFRHGRSAEFRAIVKAANAYTVAVGVGVRQERQEQEQPDQQQQGKHPHSQLPISSSSSSSPLPRPEQKKTLLSSSSTTKPNGRRRRRRRQQRQKEQKEQEEQHQHHHYYQNFHREMSIEKSLSGVSCNSSSYYDNHNNNNDNDDDDDNKNNKNNNSHSNIDSLEGDSDHTNGSGQRFQFILRRYYSWKLQRQRFARYHPRTVEVFHQACFYLGAFYLVHFWSTMNRILETVNGGKNSFVLDLFHSFFDPLQGFLNFCVYQRPRYLRLRRKLEREYAAQMAAAAEAAAAAAAAAGPVDTTTAEVEVPTSDTTRTTTTATTATTTIVDRRRRRRRSGYNTTLLSSSTTGPSTRGLFLRVLRFSYSQPPENENIDSTGQSYTVSGVENNNNKQQQQQQ